MNNDIVVERTKIGFSGWNYIYVLDNLVENGKCRDENESERLCRVGLFSLSSCSFITSPMEGKADTQKVVNCENNVIIVSLFRLTIWMKGFRSSFVLNSLSLFFLFFSLLGPAKLAAVLAWLREARNSRRPRNNIPVFNSISTWLKCARNPVQPQV